MTSLLLMESISRIQHTSKWEQSQTKSFFALNPFLPLFFWWNLLALAFQTHPPLLADCFTAIMSELMMCLAIRKLIQLAAMSQSENAHQFCSLLIFLWLTLRYPLNSPCSYSPHTPSTQLLTFTLIWWIDSHAHWIWGAPMQRSGEGIAAAWTVTLQLTLGSQPGVAQSPLE